MITSNVIQRVFHLKFGVGTGTCFAIDVNERQYIVTAKHVVEGLTDHQNVEIYFKGNWTPTAISLIGHHPTADISVFSINTILSKLKMLPSSNGLTYGQDIYFLGFPYRLQDEQGSQLNRDFPIPLVKKGILSSITVDNTGKYLLLDGINNPGFSGGPVVFKEPGQNEYKVAAVISAFKSAEEPTYHQSKKTQISVRVNTGIIIAYNIENAIDIISKNPLGKEIKESVN